MDAVTEIIIKHGLAARFIKASQLARRIDGSNKRRYGLVNRALKSGELLRIQRGLYTLADQYRSVPVHPFTLAQAMAPGSYISLETALAYHGWIPERVYTTASIVSGRKSRQYEDERFGAYSFHPLAVHTGYFLEKVRRSQINNSIVLVAQPCRALMDLICLKKIPWSGIDWLTSGLRISSESLARISKEDIDTLKQVYKHKQVQLFLTELSLELGF